MKSLLFACPLAVLAVGWVSVASAVPAVSNVTVEQDTSDHRAVTVSYSLTGAPQAVVTVDFQTNTLASGSGAWVSIGEKNFITVSGDVNRLVDATEGVQRRQIVWNARDEWPDVKAKQFRAQLTAWATNAPPDYMVIDLRDVTHYPVNYYVSEAALPYGAVTNRIYTDELLVLRRIHARGKTWLRGASRVMPQWFYEGYGDSPARITGVEKQHPVMLTRDYYIGVYKVTVGQYNRIMDAGTPRRARVPKRTCFGADGSWNVCWRGGGCRKNWPTLAADGSLDYVASHAVDPASPFGKLRSRVGWGLFDFPTDAQWEFAARAETDEPVAYGLDRTDISTFCAEHGRVASNCTKPDIEGETEAICAVGSYQPNPWGLYDMMGLYPEFCLDRWGTAQTGGEHYTDYDPNVTLVDPYGGRDNGTGDGNEKVVIRGGYNSQGSAWCCHCRAGSASAYLGGAVLCARVTLDLN